MNYLIIINNYIQNDSEYALERQNQTYWVLNEIKYCGFPNILIIVWTLVTYVTMFWNCMRCCVTFSTSSNQKKAVRSLADLAEFRIITTFQGKITILNYHPSRDLNVKR